MHKYKLKEVYAVPLKKDYHAKEALGVLSICTTQESELSHEELAMIDELAGDVGFAVNSFNQKERLPPLLL